MAKQKQKKRNHYSALIRKRFAIIGILLVAIVGVFALRMINAAPYDGWQRTRIVNMAKSQLGQKEWSGRVLEYSEGNRENWCADFVSWVYLKAGYPFYSPESGRSTWRIPLVYKQYPGVPNLRDYFVWHHSYKTKETGYVPGPGDVVIFARNGRSHTGIIESASNNSSKGGVWIYTVEGNTSTNDVARRSYSLNDPTIDGYGTIINSQPQK